MVGFLIFLYLKLFKPYITFVIINTQSFKRKNKMAASIVIAISAAYVVIGAVATVSVGFSVVRAVTNLAKWVNKTFKTKLVQHEKLLQIRLETA